MYVGYQRRDSHVRLHESAAGPLRPPTHGELEELTESARAELHRELDATGRRKLLRLTDAQNALLEEAKLSSFLAGFKLAWGIAKELEVYSFAQEDEEHARRLAEEEEA